MALLLFSGIYASFMSCTWFLLGCRRDWGSVSATSGRPLPACEPALTWLHIDPVVDVQDPLSAYVRSLHFIVQTLFTVGFGDIHPVNNQEFVFTLLNILVASLFYAVLISALTSLLGNREVSTKRYRAEFETLKRYLKVRSVPLVIQARIKGYYDFVYGRTYGVPEDRFLPCVPESIRSGIYMQCGEQLLRSVPFFRSQLNTAFISRCVQLLQFRTYAPGCYLYRRGEKPRELVLIRSGRVELLNCPYSASDRRAIEKSEKEMLNAHTGTGSVPPVASADRPKPLTGKKSGEQTKSLLTLVEGDYTGDVHLLFDMTADVSACVAQYVEALVLTTQDFQRALCETGHGVGSHRIKGMVLKSAKGTGAANISSNQCKTSGVKSSFSQTRQAAIHGQVSFVGTRRDTSAASSSLRRLSDVNRQSLMNSRNNGNTKASSSSAAVAAISMQDKMQLAFLEEVYQEITAMGQEPVWHDYHLVALQDTVEAHKSLLTKLVRIQSTYSAGDVSGSLLGTRRKGKSLLDMLGHEGGADQPREKQYKWWDLFHRLQPQVIAPDNSFRLYWDLLMILSIMYYVIGQPLRTMVAAWCEAEVHLPPSRAAREEVMRFCLSQWHPSLGIDYFVDTVFLVNIYLKARLFAFREFDDDREIVVCDPDSIWETYRGSWCFYSDVALVLPFDFLALFNGYILFYRLLKTAYALKLPSITVSVQHFLERERNWTISSESVTVVHLFFTSLSVITWFAFGWSILLYSSTTFSNDIDVQSEQNWVASFYYSLTAMTTVGYGDIFPKRIDQTWFVIILSSVGPAFTATIIANVASYVHSVDISGDNLQHRSIVLSQFLQFLGHGGHLSSANNDKKTEMNTSSNEPALIGRRKALALTKVKSTSTCPAPPKKLSATNAASAASANYEGHDEGTAVEMTQITKPVAGDIGNANIGNVTIAEAVQDYYNYIENERLSLHEAEVLQQALPQSFRDDVRMAIYEKLCMGVSLFQRFSPEMMRALILKGKICVYNKKSIVLDWSTDSSGANTFSVVASGIFIICLGTVSVIRRQKENKKAFQQNAQTAAHDCGSSELSSDTSTPSSLNVQISQLHEGDVFAEDSLLQEWIENPYRVKALADCEFLYISRKEFNNVLNLFPDAKQHVQYRVPAEGVLNKTTVQQKHEEKVALEYLHGTREGKDKMFVHPKGIFYVMWCFLLFLSISYNMFLLPLRIVYLEGYFGTSISWSLLAADYVIDVLYVSDIFLRSYCLGFYDRNDLVMVRLRILEKYRRRGKPWNQYYLHVVASLPLDSIVFVAMLIAHDVSSMVSPATGNYSSIGGFEIFDLAQLLALLRMNRLLRVADLPQLLRTISSSFLAGWPIVVNGMSAWMSRTFAGSVKRQMTTMQNHRVTSSHAGNILGLTNLLLVIYTGAHFIGCAFFLIANVIHVNGSATNWADEAGILRKCSYNTYSIDSAPSTSVGCTYPPSLATIFNQYVHSLYWAVCVMYSVGYGDITPVANIERVFNILLFVMGTFAYAMVIVYVNALVCSHDVTSDLFKSRIDRVKGLLERENVTAKAKIRALTYLDRLWVTQKGAVAEEIQLYFAPMERLYVYALHNNPVIRRNLKQMFFVCDTSLAFKHAFISRLRLRQYLRGDTIFHSNEIANTLYVMYRGEVSMQKQFHSRKSLESDADADGANDPLTSVQDTCDEQDTKASLKSKRKPESCGRGISDQSSSQNSQSRTLSSVREGLLGEYEFFSRSCYSCDTVVTSGSNSSTNTKESEAAGDTAADEECCLFELEWDEFWDLLVEHDLQSEFLQALGAVSGSGDTTPSPAFEEVSRRSTTSVVRNFEGNLNKKMVKMLNMISNDIVVSKTSAIILPDTAFVRHYQLCNFVVTMYLLFTIPYYIAFSFGLLDRNGESHSPLKLSELTAEVWTIAVMDVFVGLFTCFEIYFSFYHFALAREQVLITEQCKFREIYIREQLLLDLFSAVPAYLVFFASSDGGIIYLYLRLILLFRIRKLPTAFRAMIQTIEMYLLRGNQFNGNLLRVVKFVLCVWGFIHCTSCIFTWVGYTELWLFFQSHDILDETDRAATSWIVANDFDRQGLVPKQIYLRGFYWSAYTIITVGYGSISMATNAERIVAMCCMSLGAIICNAGVAAVLGSIIGTTDRLSGTCRRQLECSLRFCKSNRVEYDTECQLRDYHQYVSQHLDNNTTEEEDFLSLGSSFRFDYMFGLAHESIEKCIMQCPFEVPFLYRLLSSESFLNMSSKDRSSLLRGFIHSLIRLMHFHITIPGDLIMGRRTMPRSANDDGKMDLLVLRRGDCFYEVEDGGDGGDAEAAFVDEINISPGEALISRVNTELCCKYCYCPGCCEQQISMERAHSINNEYIVEVENLYLDAEYSVEVSSNIGGDSNAKVYKPKKTDPKCKSSDEDADNGEVRTYTEPEVESVAQICGDLVAESGPLVLTVSVDELILSVSSFTSGNVVATCTVDVPALLSSGVAVGNSDQVQPSDLGVSKTDAFHQDLTTSPPTMERVNSQQRVEKAENAADLLIQDPPVSTRNVDSTNGGFASTTSSIGSHVSESSRTTTRESQEASLTHSENSNSTAHTLDLTCSEDGTNCGTIRVRITPALAEVASPSLEASLSSSHSLPCPRGAYCALRRVKYRIRGRSHCHFLRVKAGSLERLVQQYVNAADAPLVARFPTARQADTTVVDGDAAFAKIPAALSTGVSAARAALRGSSNAGGHNNNNGHSNAVFHRGVGVDCSVSSASASN